jgi:hypothetical protein
MPLAPSNFSAYSDHQALRDRYAVAHEHYSRYCPPAEAHRVAMIYAEHYAIAHAEFFRSHLPADLSATEECARHAHRCASWRVRQCVSPTQKTAPTAGAEMASVEEAPPVVIHEIPKIAQATSEETAPTAGAQMASGEKAPPVVIHQIGKISTSQCQGRLQISADAINLGSVQSYNNWFTRLVARLFALSIEVDFDGKTHSVNRKSYAKLLTKLHPHRKIDDIAQCTLFRMIALTATFPIQNGPEAGPNAPKKA